MYSEQGDAQSVFLDYKTTSHSANIAFVHQ